MQPANIPPSEPFLVSADAMASMDPALPPLLANAGLVIQNDRILAVGELSDLRSRHGNLPHQHHSGVLLPGLINAHTHLELSYQSAAKLNPAHFTRWVSSLISSYPAPDQIEAVTRAAIRDGAQQSLRAGVTTVGDISRHCQITRDEFAALHQSSPISAPRVVSFGEIVALGKRRDRLPSLLDPAATSPPAASPHHLITALSPHAPYTVEGPALRKIVQRAIIKRFPIAMHLAELSEETAFLRDLSGPLGRDWDLMQKMDILDNQIPPYDGGPIRWAQRWGLLITDPRHPSRDVPLLLAHVNYCDNAELAQLAGSHISVAYCPRTHAYFNHQPHRYHDMLDSGINVCLATDSLASNPDLSVLKEAQFIYHRDHVTPPVTRPIIDPHLLLDMITRRPALALGLEKNLGTLTPGKLADIIILPIQSASSSTPLFHEILTNAPKPTALWLGGRRVY